MSALRERVVRKIRELGSEQAAEFFGVSPAIVRQWELGSKAPSLAAAEKVFEASEDGEGKLLDANWEGRSVTLCLPWYRDVHPQTALSLLACFDRPKMGALLNFGDAFIAHSRNVIAERFMAGKAEWSLWVDSDIVFPIGNAKWFNDTTGFNLPEQFAGLHTINRLLGHGKTLVGGTYYGRTSNGRPLFAEGWSDAQERVRCRRGPRDLVQATNWVATGCLLIHRSVFAAITKKFPELDGQWFSTSEHDLVRASKDALEQLRLGKSDVAFQTLSQGLEKSRTISRLGTGEDVIFCRRAAQAGHVPHVDLGLICGHIGSATFGPYNTHD